MCSATRLRRYGELGIDFNRSLPHVLQTEVYILGCQERVKTVTSSMIAISIPLSFQFGSTRTSRACACFSTFASATSHQHRLRSNSPHFNDKILPPLMCKPFDFYPFRLSIMITIHWNWAVPFKNDRIYLIVTTVHKKSIGEAWDLFQIRCKYNTMRCYTNNQQVTALISASGLSPGLRQFMGPVELC